MIDYDIWYASVRLPYKIKFKLLEEYINPQNIWEHCVNKRSIATEAYSLLTQAWNEAKINEVKKVMIEHNINVVNYNNELYPKKLKECDSAPCILFYKGDIERVSEGCSVSIVGSRRCTSYGINATNIISSELSKNGISIISGLARGIDTYAHSAALQSNGFTCAVLGCGLNIIYPKENRKLYDNIASSGCVLSEFLPGTEPLSQNFPIRNRIISALSDVVVIVEAGLKSGSLITAGLALNQGKDVMAVPGSIFSEQSKGCNKLIRDGAYPITCLEDIFELINSSFRATEKKNIELVNPEEEKIYAVLSDNPIHIDDILRITHIDINHLYEVLFELQLKDEIMCLAGNYYVKIQKTI